MKFKNTGNAVQVRLDDGLGYKWELLRTGEIIELPEQIGINYGFEKVTTQGKIGGKIVETKQFENDFLKELENIKGIGKKTAEDIATNYTKESLIKAIQNKENLPFRNDVEKLLRSKYVK